MDEDEILIRASAIDAIVAHARADAPRECCGLLIGAERTIYKAIPAANLDPLPETRFQVDPKTHIDLRRRLRGSDFTILGAYHSHPSSRAAPSPSDIDEAAYPEFAYLIVSLLPPAPVLRAYRIIRKTVADLRLTAVNEGSGS